MDQSNLQQEEQELDKQIVDLEKQIAEEKQHLQNWLNDLKEKLSEDEYAIVVEEAKKLGIGTKSV